MAAGPPWSRGLAGLAGAGGAGGAGGASASSRGTRPPAGRAAARGVPSGFSVPSPSGSGCGRGGGYPRGRGRGEGVLATLSPAPVSPRSEVDSCASGDGGLSATGRYLALGGERSAPRQFAEGCRWIGGTTAEINDALIAQCNEGSEDGKITDLNFRFKFVQDMQGLESCAAHLRTLDLSSNNLREIYGLEGMGKLKELKLGGCQIGRIQNLEQCVSLASLHLGDNCLTAADGLEGLRSLEYLSLDGNRIQRLAKGGLARLVRLRELHIARNQLSNLEGIAALPSLESVDASNNRIREVTSEHMRGLTKLTDLLLAGNLLETLPFLKSGAHLPNLCTLDISGNKLTPEALKWATMPQLSELNLADNCLIEIPESATAAWPSLEILDLSGNNLAQLDDLKRLKALPLKELLLRGNPVASQAPAELNEAIRCFDALEFFDDHPVEALLPMLADGAVGGEEPETFHLTRAGDAALATPLGAAAAAAPSSRPGTAASSRPGTAGGSRPGTGLTRPGTAQKLSEAGVKDPLMHANFKLSERRCASLEQVSGWEKQTLGGLAAIDKQVQRVVQQTDAELRDMNRYLDKARKVWKREEELQASGEPPPPRKAPMPSVPERRLESGPPSARALRLREAVGQSRVEVGSSHDLGAPPPRPPALDVPSPWKPASPTSSATPSPHGLPRALAMMAARAACDEEIEEDAAEEADGTADEAPPPEVDEDGEDNEGGEEEASSKAAGLGPTSVELRVDQRALARRAGGSASAGGGARRGAGAARARGASSSRAGTPSR